jgi:hypothetical protein
MGRIVKTLAFLGTLKEIGSTKLLVTLYARTTSHSLTLTERLGKNAMPR